MKGNRGNGSLRERQTAATREEIMNVAMEMLTAGADAGFSHEAIAEAAGMGARTVYRHFPDRAQLMQALWLRLRERTKTRFPAHEKEIASLIRAVFHEFDEREGLIRSVLNSEAGTEVRERGGAEGRPAFASSLEPLLADRSASERARIVAVFVAIYSAPFWQLLRDRGGLTGPEAQEAAAWTMETLIHSLRARARTTRKRKADEKRAKSKRQIRHSRRRA
jgi:AcrR family transcriptional regulator